MIDEIRDAYTKEAKIYDGSRFESKIGRFYHEIEKRRILEWLKGPKILELGCGTGRYAIPFTELGFDYTGIDITPAMLEVARKKANANGVTPQLKIMDAHSLNFEDGTFDSVFCDRTFKFLDPERVLKEVYRVLKPHGRVVIDTEVEMKLMRGLLNIHVIRMVMWYLIADRKTHKLRKTGGLIPLGKIYTKPRLGGLLRNADFKVLECRKMLWPPPPLARLLPESVLGKLGTRSWLEEIMGSKLLGVGEK